MHNGFKLEFGDEADLHSNLIFSYLTLGELPSITTDSYQLQGGEVMALIKGFNSIVIFAIAFSSL